MFLDVGVSEVDARHVVGPREGELGVRVFDLVVLVVDALQSVQLSQHLLALFDLLFFEQVVRLDAEWDVKSVQLRSVFICACYRLVAELKRLLSVSFLEADLREAEDRFWSLGGTLDDRVHLDELKKLLLRV